MTAPCISEGVDAIFWGTYVLQVSQTEPAVRHAVLAVSSLHEGLMNGSLSGGTTQSFALQQYNKAIAHVLNQMQNPLTKLSVSLITCVLFVCVEFLQGKDKESLIHLEQGRQLLTHLDRRANDPDMGCIVRYIVPLYTRLSLPSFLFGGMAVQIPGSPSSPSEVPATFESIDGLRASMHEFMEQAFHFTERARPVKNSSDSVPREMMKALEEDQDRLLSRLARLNVTFSLFRASRAKPDPENTLSVLQMYLHAQHIWISTALSSSEIVYDDYLPNFAAIVPLAAAYLDLEVSQHQQMRHTSWQAIPSTMLSQYLAQTGNQVVGQVSDLPYETHIIPPLYYVATKCRHPLIRRSALDLLRRNPFRHESLWRASVMGTLAGHIVSLESQVHTLPATPGPTCTPRGSYLSLGDIYHSAQSTTIPEPPYLRMGGPGRHIPPDTMITPTEELPAGLQYTSAVTPITELDFEDLNRDEHIEYVIHPVLRTEVTFSPSLSQPPSITTSTNGRSSSAVMEAADGSLSPSTSEISARQLPVYQQQGYYQHGRYGPVPAMNSLARRTYSCAPNQVQQLMPDIEQPDATISCVAHASSDQSSPVPYEQCYQITSDRHERQHCQYQITTPAPALSRQQEHLTSSHNPKNPITDAPFGLPEEARVHDAILGRETEDGSWVAIFRQLHGVDAAWDVPTGWVPTGYHR